MDGATDIDSIERQFNGAAVRAAEEFHQSNIDALVEVHSLFPRLKSSKSDNRTTFVFAKVIVCFRFL